MATESTNSTRSTPDAPPAPSPPSLPSSPPLSPPHSPPLSPPLSPPPSPPLSPPPSPPLAPPPSPPFSSPPPPSPSTPTPSTPPPPAPLMNPPSPPEVHIKNNEPPPPKSPETSPPSPSTNHPMQPPPTHLHPSPPSQDSPQNSPAPPIVTQPIYSPPAPPSGASATSPPSAPSNNTSLSGSPPSLLPSVPPPGLPLTTNPITSSPTPSGTSPVLQLSPTTSSSNDLSGRSQTDGGGLGTTGGVAIGVVLGFLLLGVVGLAIWWIRQHKKKVFALSGLPTTFIFTTRSDSSLLKKRSSSIIASGGSGHESGNGTPGMVTSQNWFSYEELSRVTNEFSESNLLGEGGFGSVFKGRLPDGREVAVKQLKEGASQGEREFRAEVETISRVHHRHLVSLVGYCISNKQRLLVYDYVPNNTLHFHLHGKGAPVLDWPTRVKIATGAARGIAYLHTDCHPRIVHRDIKSSNILLDNNFDAQVSDFGLARWVSDAETHVTTCVMGTFGYMAPEYASSGKLSEKSDVFSFGVVLLELLTGRKPVDKSQPIGEQSLVEWAQPLLNHALKKEEFENLVDPRLGNSYVHSEMCRMVEAAASCVRLSAHKRPKMSRILRTLDDMASSDLSNKMMRVGKSDTMDPAQKSAEIGLFRKMAFCSGDYSTGFFMQDEEK